MASHPLECVELVKQAEVSYKWPNLAPIFFFLFIPLLLPPSFLPILCTL